MRNKIQNNYRIFLRHVILALVLCSGLAGCKASVGFAVGAATTLLAMKQAGYHR